MGLRMRKPIFKTSQALKLSLCMCQLEHLCISLFHATSQTADVISRTVFLCSLGSTLVKICSQFVVMTVPLQWAITRISSKSIVSTTLLQRQLLKPEVQNLRLTVYLGQSLLTMVHSLCWQSTNSWLPPMISSTRHPACTTQEGTGRQNLRSRLQRTSWKWQTIHGLQL